MNYKDINIEQRNKMKQITNGDVQMDWENPDFFDILLGKMVSIRRYGRYSSNQALTSRIDVIERKLQSYNQFSTDKKEFLKEVTELLNAMHRDFPDWYGLYENEVEYYLNIHQFCLIHGEGGIGKSYLIKCIEAELEKRQIPHLCVYGKFMKSLESIDIATVISESDKGFVFILDAVNEMSESGQEQLLGLVKKLREYQSIRIILTYRTNSMDAEMLQKFSSLALAEYAFPGVSFEAALSIVLKLPAPDVYKYEDILYSNNALLLNLLCSALADKKLVDETENSIASVTFILEHYIKKSISKSFRNEKEIQGIDMWKDTKRIADWMYQNGKKTIPESVLVQITKTGKKYLDVMIQCGFVSIYEGDNQCDVYFSIDSLTDFLIARSLFSDIRKKSREEQIKVIKEKTGKLYNMEEAFIIALFDNLAPDYEMIMDLLIETGLIKEFQLNTLLKVNFKKDNIPLFLKVFKPVHPESLFTIFAGYTDKPFNCVNYLNEYFNVSEKNMEQLSNDLAGYHLFNNVKGRLKNILYFVTLDNRNERRIEEAFYFALWCCSASNYDVRDLAMKLLYEIVSRNSKNEAEIMDMYWQIHDDYIKEAIILVLSSLPKDDKNIISFFDKVRVDEAGLGARSIKRIAKYLRDDYGYINWAREDLYNYSEDAQISDYLNDFLIHIDIMNKNFLPFRFWGRDHVEIHRSFLDADKEDVHYINETLNKKYSCVRTGRCNGMLSNESKMMRDICAEEYCALDVESLLSSYESVLSRILEKYGVNSENIIRQSEEDFVNSVLMKCTDISWQIFLGSLMCNYYSTEFASFNNYQDSIGYEVYDPLEYGDRISLTAPIPLYTDLIERLGDIVLNRLEVPNKKDINWVRDIELSRRNIVSLTDPLEVKGEQWILLGGRVCMHSDSDKRGFEWRDTYDIWCCTSVEETIQNDGNARYLTIELEDYTNSLFEYGKCEYKPWLCKQVKRITDREVFDDTSLVLPPASLIKFGNLQLNVGKMEWNDNNGESIIVCNNNKASYYSDPIGATVFVKKEYLDKYLSEHTMKYFAFTERFIPSTGYADETAIHYEIIDGKITKEVPNSCDRQWDEMNNPLCDNCPYGYNVSNDSSSSLFDIDEIIKLYAGDV